MLLDKGFYADRILVKAGWSMYYSIKSIIYTTPYASISNRLLSRFSERS